MISPINYNIDVQTPFQAALQGYQAGSAIRDDRLKYQLAQEQREEQKAAKEQQRQVLQSLMRPESTDEDWSKASLLLPGYKDQLKQGWEIKNTAQREQQVSRLNQWVYAINNGQPQIASRQMRELADTMESTSRGPTTESKTMRMQADSVDENPRFASGLMRSILEAHPDGSKVATTAASFGVEGRARDKAPSELRESEAKADKAVVDAKYAEQQSVLDLQKKGWDITKIQSDIQIAKEANRIAAMNAATAREGNSLKRDELSLRVQEARQKLDDKIREKVSTAESGASTIDNMLNTIERIKKNPRLDDVVGGIEGRLPSLGNDESANAIALIDTLGSQAFMAQIPSLKGMGALSNAEGEKLQSALTNLSRSQGEKQFRENLDEAARLMKKVRENLSRSTGVPLGRPDTPAAPGSRPPLDSFDRGTGGASGAY